jgi:hypothetical protein
LEPGPCSHSFLSLVFFFVLDGAPHLLLHTSVVDSWSSFLLLAFIFTTTSRYFVVSTTPPSTTPSTST